MAAEEPSCTERWEAHKNSRIASLREVFSSYQESSDEDSFPEYGLSFDYVAPGTWPDQNEAYWRYQTSWGGPSDEFRFYASTPTSCCYRIEYRFMDWYTDWGDGRGEALENKDLALMSEIWKWFVDVGSAASEFEKAMEE